MSKSVLALIALVMALAGPQFQAVASPYIGTGEYFVDPDGWNVGDTGSTFQAWDTFAPKFGAPSATLPARSPDAGLTTNPVLGTGPTVTGSGSPGTFIFVTGTNNIYSPIGNYTLNANIPNHNSGGGNGTHVIVQATASVGDPPVGVVPNTLNIVDLSNNPITGGANSSALVNGGLIAAGIVDSTMGPVQLEVRIWEFFLPNYTGDFRATWTQGIHSTLDQLRVDSFITVNALAPTAYTFQQIPEPSSMAIGLLGLAGVFVGRRSHS
jgi:hypothetical protein